MIRPSHIVVYAASEMGCEGAVRRAARLAASDTRITLVDVVPELTTLARAVLPRPLHGVHVRERESELQQQLAALDDLLPVQIRVLTGQPAQALVKMVVDERVDLLLKVSNGASDDVPLDAVDMKLLRKCPCPVWIVPAGPSRPLRRVLAAIDPFAADEPHDQALNHAILRHAVMAAQPDGAAISVVHAWEVVGERLLRRHLSSEEVEQILAETQRRAHDAVRSVLEPFRASIHDKDTVLVRGEAAEGIRHTAEALMADLIVMGTLARTGVPGLIMGNTAETVLRGVSCEVLTLKPAGFVSPLMPRQDISASIVAV